MKLDKFSSNIRISLSAKTGKNVKTGDNTIICNDCVIGDQLNDYYYQADTMRTQELSLGRTR